MKALKIIGIILIILVVLFFVVALFLPSKLYMERSIVINKPASLVFKQVNNYKNWEAWSPWSEGDPEMTMTYSGPDLGLGATYDWKSPLYGDGGMTIIQSEPYKQVRNELKFEGQEPAYTDFILEKVEGGTKVTWTLDIPKLTYPVERYFGLIMPKMMDKFYTSGLENLKKVCEAMPDPYVIQQVTMPETKAVTVLDSCNWSDFESTMDKMFSDIMAYLKVNKDVQIVGAHFTRYLKWDEENQFAVFKAGVPIDKDVKVKGRVEFEVYPETKAITGTYFGEYEGIGTLYMALEEYIKEFGLTEACCPMEVYVVSPPDEMDPANWQTDVYFPIQ